MPKVGSVQRDQALKHNEVPPKEKRIEVISPSSEPPKTTIDHIRFLGSDVAVVQMSWQFASGILLTDGSRIPPYSQIDIYVVTKSQSKWLVAAHSIQEKKS